MSRQRQTVKVAAVQCSSVLGDVFGNQQKMTTLAEEAAARGAKFIVFPEAAITGYISQDRRTAWHVNGRPIEAEFSGRDPLEFAQTLSGKAVRHFCDLARRMRAYLTIPFVETVSEKGVRNRPKFYNTVCLAAPSGEIVAHYRKLNPWPFVEKSWATPGDLGVVTYQTEFGLVGFGICFDIHTILEQYQPLNIWALLHPTAWADNEHPAEWFYHRLPAMVKRFGHYAICANWSVDQPQFWRGYGFSEIISPEGEVLAGAKSLYGSEIVYAEIAASKS